MCDHADPSLITQIYSPSAQTAGLPDLLAQLNVRGFRNLESSSYDLADGTHLILGVNGAGKTSFLEAIYVLSTTRSFRTPRIADCCQHGGYIYNLYGEVIADQRLKLEFSWNDGRRERSINGERTSLAEHLSTLPTVCWSAGDGNILVGPPAERRRFLDRGILGLRPIAIDTFSRYRRALQEKRQLLRHGGAGLQAWNEVLASAASDLIRFRSRYTVRLREVLFSILEESDLELGRIQIEYRCSLQSGFDGASAIAAELMAASEREKTLRQPILGPHRDDLVIRWGGHDLRRVASAGERKALGLVLVATQGRILSDSGRDVVYLLDDADTELDKQRLASLWSVFGSVRQMFLTSNRRHVWNGVGVDHRWHCSAGRLSLDGS